LNTAKEDILLWESFREGDREAFATLFRTHYELLYRYGGKFTSNPTHLEDTIQELFVELWQAKNRTPVVSVRAYLLKSLKYKLLKAYRKTREIVPITEEDGIFEWSHENFLIAAEEDAEKKRRILRALEQLTPRQKEIIYLKYYQDLSYDEVSEIMNINYQVARNLLYQAIRSLKNRLAGPLQIIFLLFAFIIVFAND
jgi:RNA polymerase sigma factor (sigma-70 family)